IRKPVLPDPIPRGAEPRRASSRRSRPQPALQAGDRSRIEADAGAGRAAFSVQYARIGAIPRRDRPAQGESHAESPDRLSSIGVAAASLEQYDARTGKRARASLPLDHADAHGNAASLLDR